ncbi:MAG: flagellar biosynthetic protein FliO [Cellulosilyticaceae bacterium]
MIQSTGESVIDILVILIAFIGILWLSYVVTKKMATMKQGSLGNKNLRMIETIHIGQNQFLSIVQVGEEYHLFATSKEQVTYCHKIDENTLRFETAPDTSFSAYLNYFKQDKQEKKDEGE